MISGPKVDIYVGPTKKHYSLPKLLLCHYSTYFDRCFNGVQGGSDPEAWTPGGQHRILRDYSRVHVSRWLSRGRGRENRKEVGYGRMHALCPVRGLVRSWSDSFTDRLSALENSVSFRYTSTRACWGHIPSIPGAGSSSRSCGARTPCSKTWFNTPDGKGQKIGGYPTLYSEGMSRSSWTCLRGDSTAHTPYETLVDARRCLVDGRYLITTHHHTPQT